MHFPWHWSLISMLSFWALSSASTTLNGHRLNRRILDHQNRSALEKRAQFENARITHFEVGLGACGNYNVPSDFVIAIGIEQYGGGDHCGGPVTITYNGKTAHAIVADKCMGCAFGEIDLSNGLFEFLVPGGLPAGTVYGGWSFGGGDQPPPSPSPETTQAPKPSPTPSPSQTSTTHTSSAHPSSSATSSSQAPSSTASSSSISATPSSTSVPTQALGTFEEVFQSFIGLGALAVLTDNS